MSEVREGETVTSILFPYQNSLGRRETSLYVCPLQPEKTRFQYHKGHRNNVETSRNPVPLISNPCSVFSSLCSLCYIRNVVAKDRIFPDICFLPVLFFRLCRGKNHKNRKHKKGGGAKWGGLKDLRL